MMQISDEAILEGIRLKSQFVVEVVYDHHFSKIRRYVLLNSGNDEDAEDIFQEGLMVIYQKIKNNNLVLTSSFGTFFISICKRLWLKKATRQASSQRLKHAASTGNFLHMEAWLDELQLNDEVLKLGLYQKHYLELPQDCKQVLSLFMEGFSIKEIADIVGYENEDYVKTRRFKCKELLKKNIKKDPQYRKYFYNDKNH
jgi:RNA polymerase sigma factor (sigma-70 family)